MTRLLMQHPHDGELSGVMTYVAAMSRSIESLTPITVSVISSKRATLAQKIKEVAKSDLIQFNSHDLPMVLAAKLLRKSTNIKYHWPFWLSTKFEYHGMDQRQRLITELRYLWATERAPRGVRRITRAYARLIARLLFTSLVDTRVACSEFTARACDAGELVMRARNPLPYRVSSLPDSSGPRSGALYVGRISSDKGIDVLIDAWRLVETRHSLTIVGDGPDLKLIKQLAEGDLRINIVGRRSHDEVRDAMSGAIVTIVPSRWNEPAPYVPMEAALAGSAVIAANKGGLPETAGPAAWIFKSEDRFELARLLEFALANPQQSSDRAKQNGEYLLDNFSERHCIEELSSAWPAFSLALRG